MTGLLALGGKIVAVESRVVEEIVREGASFRARVGSSVDVYGAIPWVYRCLIEAGAFQADRLWRIEGDHRLLQPPSDQASGSSRHFR